MSGYASRLKRLEDIERAKASDSSRLIKTWLDLAQFVGQSPEAQRRYGSHPRYHKTWDASIKAYRETAEIEKETTE